MELLAPFNQLFEISLHPPLPQSKPNEESGDSQQPSQPSQQPSVQAALPQTQLMLAGGQITGVSVPSEGRPALSLRQTLHHGLCGGRAQRGRAGPVAPSRSSLQCRARKQSSLSEVAHAPVNGGLVTPPSPLPLARGVEAPGPESLTLSVWGRDVTAE